jgi:hypothetical protein
MQFYPAVQHNWIPRGLLYHENSISMPQRQKVSIEASTEAFYVQYLVTIKVFKPVMARLIASTPPGIMIPSPRVHFRGKARLVIFPYKQAFNKL